MTAIRRKMIGVLVSAFLFAVYCTLPSIGAVSIGRLVLTFVFYMIVCTAGSLLVYKAAAFLLPKLHCEKIESCLYETWTQRRFVLVIWGILVLGLIPAYLAFFPGIFGYDAPNQLQQLMGERPYSSHHPLLHTLLLGAFLHIGKGIFGTFNGGVGLFCIVQGLVISGSFAYSFLIMRRHKTPFVILLVSLVWCVWNPVLQVLAFNTTKDVLFGALFLHFVLNCYDWLASDGERTKLQMAMLVLSGVLMCLLRNQGIYIVIVLILVSLMVDWKDKRFWLALCVVVLLSQTFFTVTNRVGNVVKGDDREMLSVPMQQMALVCKLYQEGQPVNLTQEEFDKFTLVVDQKYLKDYSLIDADKIKSHFNTHIMKEDLSGYMLLYISVGLRNPGYYLTAFRGMILTYWDMSINPVRILTFDNTFPEVSEKYGISQESLLPEYRDYLTDYITNRMSEKLPVISWFLQPGICIWLMSALLGLAIAKKDKAVFVAVMAGMLFLGTLLLGPIALLRYIYPLMLFIPWLLGLLCEKVEK